MATSCGFQSLMLAAKCRLAVDRLSSCLPLVVQVRHKLVKTRYRAPHEAKEKDKWTKVIKEKDVHVKDVRKTNSPVWLSRVPVDDVWIRTYYPRQKYSLEEIIIRHKEYADPTMLDNMEGFIYADMELDMRTSKKTKFLSSLKGTVLLPHQFSQTVKQKIAIFCKKEEDVEKAKSLGADFFGCDDLIKQVKDGLISKDDIDVVLCTPDAVTEVISIRPLLRDKFPSKVKGTLSTDVVEMWDLYTKGVTYTSQKETEAVSKMQVPLGQLKMPIEHLVANFKAYVDSICMGRSKTLGPFILKVFLVAPPSPEKFLLKVEDYVPGFEFSQKKVASEEDVDSDEEGEENKKA